MLKKFYLLSGSIIAACTSLIGQISNFIELSDTDNPVSDVTEDMNVHIVDLDDDGFDEIVMYSDDFLSNRIYLNDGAGNLTLQNQNSNLLSEIFNSVVAGGAFKGRLEFADFDNDGDTDVMAMSSKYGYNVDYDEGSFKMFANDGSQDYSDVTANYNMPVNTGSGQTMDNFSTGTFSDVDEDGDIDIVGAEWNDLGGDKIFNAYHEIHEFNQTTMDFEDPVSFLDLANFHLVFIDIDEDGDDDAFHFPLDNLGFNMDSIYWQEKTAANVYQPPAISPVAEMHFAPSVDRLSVGDIDNDGALELILYDPVSGDMRMFEQDCLGPPGTSCDDGDDCTINDALDSDCNCVGEFQDTDNDGICDADDNTNGDCTLGDGCDDGDDCTVNDALDADCNCVGEFQDADNDGICDADDDTNGDCTLGGACDDGDECTIDDVFDADCNCAGTLTGDSDMDGICDAIDDTNGDCTLGGACDDGDECTIDDVFDVDCNCAGTLTGDADMDGICDAIDDTNGDCELGAACDDGDACTEEDVFDADCQCVGVFQDEDEDTVCDAEDECPGLDDLLLDIVGDADMDGDVDCDDLLVSVEEILTNQIAIFPNPTNGILRLESEILVQEILVYSALGKVVAEVSNNTKQIDLQSFAQGAYFIEVRTEKGTLRKRIILQK